jgi:hypothetical protein
MSTLLDELVRRDPIVDSRPGSAGEESSSCLDGPHDGAKMALRSATLGASGDLVDLRSSDAGELLGVEPSNDGEC